ncbi:ribose ABC transporter permease [Aureimonas sp. Leaf454]|uniref:class I SAM-dependent methyltransferase n=1 Tax=Aureimonas sp. Leaf454 TaxID=1736381 RepID=UPI0006F67A1B|nr:methyltransferase domain-containing protein [Aureimonas sp. Leaf454]KQT43054.1 ribose ABC transporter permease [Aureimonas sp. Leaf454]
MKSESSNAGDVARFFATWIRHPLKLGAVAPSSPAYCREMVERATTDIDGPVLELGPGLGVVTRALLDKGVSPGRITSIEYEKSFADVLKGRFPEVNVVEGDGFDLDRTLGTTPRRRFAAILFAIPILNLSQEQRQALFTRYFDHLLPGGNLTQLSYLPTAPVKPVPGVFTVTSSPIVWSNIPPARVWVYAQDQAAASGSRAP